MTQQATELWPDRMTLIVDGRELPLVAGRRYTIGRSPSCQIVLDDRTVSRRHARLSVGEDLVIEDLESANGVFVDGSRVDRRRSLRPGQRVVIGSFELALCMASERPRLRETLPRHSVPTLTEIAADPPTNSGATDQSDYFEVLAGLSRRLIARGQVEEAELVIRDHLDTLLEQARAGSIDAAFGERAAAHALRLAEASERATWFDYVFELYSVLGQLMPEALADECYRVARQVRRPAVDLLVRYVEQMERLGLEHPSERFRVRRLQGLAGMLTAVG